MCYNKIVIGLLDNFMDDDYDGEKGRMQYRAHSGRAWTLKKGPNSRVSRNSQ